MKFIPLFLLIVGLTACTSTSKRQETKILVYQNEEEALVTDQLPQASEEAPGFVPVFDENYFKDDSLRNFSGIIIPFSALNRLDHRAIVAIKRYLEADGGGIVAIKDTLLTQEGWPWLQAWNDMPIATELKQDEGNLKILGIEFTEEDLQNAWDYAVDENTFPDYTQANTIAVPESNRYSFQVLSQGLDEPMQMAILPNFDVLFVERKGAVKLYSNETKKVRTLANFDVFSGIEDGLLGVALDPDFEQNHWVYFYYAVAGEKAINRLSRMELKENTLLLSSEKTLLEIPTQRQYCCHSAGYLQFGADGLLYLSTGDNTNAEETEGYNPVDERPGRMLADDQATSASTNDLRGKILRIKPEADGTYSIPEGNLFPEGTPNTLPEIYTMGHRNPYRFTVDSKNGFVYWGDIGPDTKVLSSEGTLSFDEINQAREPGFFGWPYFLGQNESFPYYNFETKVEGPKFDPVNPINKSPNNTGLRELPPAQPAMIWYGDGASAKFPLVGKGGQSAMAGPVYYSDLYPNAPYKLSSYYDGKLIIYDWVRRWFMAVTFDEQMNYLRMEPFLEHITFTAPTDIKIASDGAIYILEYGTNWFAKNNDARLIRIEYAEGNRKPTANIQTSGLYGAAPFKVDLSAEGSEDFDKEDSLTFIWSVEGKEISGKKVSHIFDKQGTYNVALSVTDNHGESTQSTVDIKVGNTPPVVDIKTKANSSFYWDDSTIDYQVEIGDLEDSTIDPNNVAIKLTYLPRGKDVAVALANPEVPQNLEYVEGQTLINELDCKACHSLNVMTVGPTYKDIASRYSGTPGIEDVLVQKIIDGGSGNWGQKIMSSHPDLSKDEARAMVQYILSLNENHQSLPLQGTLALKDHIGKGNEGSYLLVANYTDKGANDIEALSTQKHIALHHPQVQVEDHDGGDVTLNTITTEFRTYASIRHGSYVKFDQIDLTYLQNIRYSVQQVGIGGTIELRIDKKDGPVLATVTIPEGKSPYNKENWKDMIAPIKKSVGVHDVYLVFSHEDAAKGNLFYLDWLYFSNGK